MTRTPLEPDGLYLPEVGSWATNKHRLAGVYFGIFARAMSGQWPCRVYVDLFAGAGWSRLKGSRRLIEGSPMIALGVDVPFDRYVFCDKSRRCIKALRARIARTYPSAPVTFVSKDCNEAVRDVLDAIPSESGVLTLCFVDPFAVSNLRFETLRALAKNRRTDFLVLVPTGMDINRNQARLRASDETLLDEFLGDAAWRSEWRSRTKAGRQPSFGAFVLEQFGRSMQRIDYLYDGPGREVAVTDGSRILYHLALYSRHSLGAKFWKAAMKAAEQPPLF